MAEVVPHKSILILGIGNVLMSDDGIGVVVAQRLQQRYRFDDNVKIIDGGTLGLDLLPLFEDITNLIMIDAVEIGQVAGTCVRWCGQEFSSALDIKVSSHQMGLKDLLAVSGLMGHPPEEMLLIGVQPGSIDIGTELTTAVEAKLETLITNILIELKKHGINATLV